jgi:hypothetical protein
VTINTNTFTATTAHNLQPKDTILISDGEIEVQATVESITSTTVFVASNDEGVNFPTFAGNLDIICDFSNSHEKGSDDAAVGRRWSPDIYENFTHILKVPYEVAASDMVHKSWIMTPDGPRWFNHEIERTSVLFDNKIELTQMFHKRKDAGNARGTIGVIPQIESRGNVANEVIASIDDLSDIAFRIKQQGGGCREFTIWGGHAQQAAWRTMLAGVNAHYAGGANYGMFQNSKEMALMLGFNSCYIDGITFHFSNWELLDDPTLMGNAKFLATSLACLIVPSGNKYVNENGNVVSKPYLGIGYRADGQYNRKREIKIFGPGGGTQHKKDTQMTHFQSEFLNQVVGSNEYFVVRKALNAAFYS